MYQRKAFLKLFFYFILIGHLFAGEIHQAAQNGDLEQIKKLLMTTSELVNARDDRECTPLHFAADRGHLAVVEYLLEQGADINAGDIDGDEPIHWAAYAGQKAVVELLVAKGARINAKNKVGGTPLDWAIDRGKTETADYLRSQGALETDIPDPEVVSLAPNLYRICFPFSMKSNIGVLTGTDGILLVDTGFSRRAIKKIRTALAKLNAGEIKFVINSHLHWDHIAGNEMAGPDTKMINAGTVDSLQSLGQLVLIDAPLRGRTGKQFEKYFKMTFNSEDIHIIPYPNVHSNADLLIHFTQSNVVHMGDLLLSQSFPAVGKNIDAYFEFMEKVLDIFPENTVFISGHGRDSKMADIQAYFQMLKTSRAMVEKQLLQGKSAETLKTADILADYTEWGEFLPFLNTNYWIDSIVKCREEQE